MVTNNGRHGSQLTYVKILSKSIHPISKYLAADFFFENSKFSFSKIYKI